MSQNTSHAVMAQRIEPHDSLDFFPTPPWATRALCRWLMLYEGSSLSDMTALEPACGEGHMARPLAEFFGTVRATDVHDYGFGGVDDFLLYAKPKWTDMADWIITNPPFRLAKEFAQNAVAHSKRGCALIVRTSFLEGIGRHSELFATNAPSDILQFAERVPMHKGRLDPKGVTATAYCWIVWRKGAPVGTRFHWIPPCRKKLERASDYEAAP